MSNKKRTAITNGLIYASEKAKETDETKVAKTVTTTYETLALLPIFQNINYNFIKFLM